MKLQKLTMRNFKESSGKPVRRKFRDLSGLTFGRLTVLHQCGRDKQKLLAWSCVCECGGKAVVRGSALVYGTTKSCGCLQGGGGTTHGLSGGRTGVTRLYKAWINMKSRCNNPNVPKFKNHGGRGISICSEWSDYSNFHSWAMSNGYEKNLTLESVDNNGDYSPLNCVWATYKKQNLNKRTNCVVTVNGETMTAKEWSEKLNIKAGTIYSRITSYGWSPEKAILTPIGKRAVNS